MAESKITLDPKYNKPQQEVNTVAKDSILKTLQDLCTGPEYDEYRDAKRDIDVALDLLINYPENVDDKEDVIKKEEDRGVMQPNKVVSSSDLIIISTANIGLGQPQIETLEICSFTHAHDWVQILLSEEEIGTILCRRERNDHLLRSAWRGCGSG